MSCRSEVHNCHKLIDVCHSSRFVWHSLVSIHVSRAVIWGITWKTVGVKLNGIGEENLQDLPGEGERGRERERDRQRDMATKRRGDTEGRVGWQLWR